MSIDWSADLQLFYRGFIVTTLLSSILHYSSLVDDPKVDLSIYLGYSNAHLLFSHLEPVYKSICRPIHIFCGPNIDLSDIFENTKIFLGHFWNSFWATTFEWVYEKMTEKGLKNPVWIIDSHFFYLFLRNSTKNDPKLFRLGFWSHLELPLGKKFQVSFRENQLKMPFWQKTALI